MSDLKSRANTNYIVTAQQIVKLERGLLSLRQSSKASPEAVDAIAAVQYQEILRLREELDAAMGFQEPPCDLTVSLSGPTIGIGAAPAGAVAGFLSNFRAAMQAVTAYLMTGELPGRGRLPRQVTLTSDFQFVGTARGSLKLKLNLPEPRTLFPEYEFGSLKQSLRLILETVGWVSSSKGIEELNARVDDERLARLLLAQVQRMAPTRASPVRWVVFASSLADADEGYMLSSKSIERLRDAIDAVSEHASRVTETGWLRAVDLDSGAFSLRQRPDEQPPLRCLIAREIMPQSVHYLVDDVKVVLAGALEYDSRGRPSSLIVEEVYAADDDG